MEGILKVTPDELRTTAGEFGNKGNTIKAQTDEMMQMVKNLSTVWQGEASGAYLNKFQGLQTDIDKINRMIQEHVQDLNDMAEQYDIAENTNTEQSQGLQANAIS